MRSRRPKTLAGYAIRNPGDSNQWKEEAPRASEFQLLVPQSHHRINLRRPTRRQVTGQQSDRNQ
jgi:hypothetical protein